MNLSGRLLDPKVADCSLAELEAKFLGLLSEIQIRYKDYGIFLETPSGQAVVRFLALSPESKSTVLAQLRMVYQIANEDVRVLSEKSHSAAQFGPSEEMNSLKSFLWRSSMRVANDEFFTKIRDGDIIEMYSTDHLQMYRSWSFFNFCSYSLADILVYDWNTLYSRPAWVVSRCFTEICDLLEGRRTLIKFEVPEFLLQENFSASLNSVFLKLRFASSVLDQRTGEICGYISTQKGTLVSDPTTRSKISFI